MTDKEDDGGAILYRFGRECLAKPGEHILISGYTGSGKTTTMFYLYDGLGEFAKDTKVWFDSMKSEEALTLLTMGPIRFLVPKGCMLSIKINDEMKNKIHPYEIVEMSDYLNPWKDLRADWSNVICLSAYLVDPSLYAATMGAVFTNLIWLAHKKKIITPMTIFFDEIHNIAPSNGHAYDHKHTKAGLVVQHNVERLRSMGIRIIGSTQGNYKLRKGVRSCFNWLIVKRGTTFYRGEESKLYDFNPKWGKLDNLQMVIVFPDRVFSNPLKIKFYTRGSDVGVMDYDGEIVRLEDKEKIKERAEC